MSGTDQPASADKDDLLKDQVAVNVTEEEIFKGTRVQAAHLHDPPIIYTIPDLAKDPHLLHEIVSFINKVYSTEEKSYCSASPRFPKDQDLLEQFGPDALCAVIFSKTRIIATATIVPWREPKGSNADEAFRKIRPADYYLVEDGHSYEVGGVATANNPAFRKKGLATQCIESLEKAMLGQNGGHESLIWLHTVEHQNGAYWRRRGFETVLVEWKPRGYWGAWEPFQFTTLVKKVESKGAMVEI